MKITNGYGLKALTSMGALLFSSFMAAHADPTAIPTRFNLDSGNPVTIYTQPDTKHPAPVFLICAGNGNYEVDLFGHNGEALETIPASSCIYVSSSEISATLPAKSLEEIARTGNAIGRTTSWLDTRIQELEAKSEPTEADVNLLKSFKERRNQTREINNRTQGPPHVLVTLMR